MATHRLKTWPSFFRDIEGGIKTFELRKNDRGFHLGDTLVIAEYDPWKDTFSGKEIMVRVVYFMDTHGPLEVPALCDGYCVMGIRKET